MLKANKKEAQIYILKLRKTRALFFLPLQSYFTLERAELQSNVYVFNVFFYKYRRDQIRFSNITLANLNYT